MEHEELIERIKVAITKSSGKAPTIKMEFIKILYELKQEGVKASYQQVAKRVWSKEWKDNRESFAYELKRGSLEEHRKDINERIYESDLCFAFFIDDVRGNFLIETNPETIFKEKWPKEFRKRVSNLCKNEKKKKQDLINNLLKNLEEKYLEYKIKDTEDVQINAANEYLKIIEDNYSKIYYSNTRNNKNKAVINNQYVPIEVTLGRRFRHEVESTLNYYETDDDLKRIYKFKGIDEDKNLPVRESWDKAKSEHDKIMVLADPGMGKSTLLQREAWLMAQEGQKLIKENKFEKVRFPIFLKLSDLAKTTNGLIDAIPQLIKSNFQKISEKVEKLLKENLINGKCILLLDSLDEVPYEPRKDFRGKLNSFVKDYQCKIICSSRIVGYDNYLENSKDAVIIPFNNLQINKYVNNWFDNAAPLIKNQSITQEGFLRELQKKPQLNGLAKIPLLLSMMCSLFIEDNAVLPGRRIEVYKKSVEHILGEWRKEKESEPKLHLIPKILLLQYIAYQLTREGRQVVSSVELYDWFVEYLQDNKVSIDLQNLSFKKLIKELSEDDGIIINIDNQGDIDNDRYIFLHRTFQEYLTASHLNRLYDISPDKYFKEIKRNVWNFQWNETISLLAGLMKDPIPLIQFIVNEQDDIFHSLLLLGGKCIAERPQLNDPIIEGTIKKIFAFWKDYTELNWINNVIVMLGQTNDLSFELLIDALQDKAESVSLSAIKVLGHIGSKHSIEQLIQVLRDKDIHRSRTAAYSLGETSSKEAVEPLFKALVDINKDFTSVLFALGKIGGKEAVEPLIKALGNKDNGVRDFAVFALGEIGSKEAVEPLFKALGDEDNGVRLRAVIGLGEIGGKEAVEPLIKALGDMDSNVRHSAVFILGKIGGKEAIEPLIKALGDKDNIVRIRAVIGLGEIGGKEAVEPLIKALGDNAVRDLAISSLGKIGSKKAIEPLIKALGDKDSAVRYSAVSALGRIGGKEAVEPLIKALRDKDNDVRESAVSALGKIGDKEAVEPLIIALGDKDNDVRESAVSALGKIGGKEAVEPLIKALGDKDSKIRLSAVFALEEISGKKAIEPLIKALGDKDNIVRLRAVIGLGEIGGKEAVEPLIKALGDKDNDVRESAVSALGKIGDKEAVEPLILVLSDKVDQLSNLAAEALGAIKSEKAVEGLINSLKNKNKKRRSLILEALRKIGTYHVLESIIQNPNVNIYDSDIFSIARALAIRYCEDKLPFIPVYSERVQGRSNNKMSFKKPLKSDY